MISAVEALQRLRDGNRRYVAGDISHSTSANQMRRDDLVAGQNPFAAVLACSDSRAPVELVFDQGLGDLFVIRVAGNIVAPSQIGSVEYAASRLGTKLVVVLGHSNCGAVGAALKELTRDVRFRSPNLRSIVNRIRPALEPMLESGGDVTLHDAVAANIRNAVRRLQSGSLILRRLVDDGELKVVGAEYSIETGEVEFFD